VESAGKLEESVCPEWSDGGMMSSIVARKGMLRVKAEAAVGAVGQ
jgi:hypothetical protein